MLAAINRYLGVRVAVLVGGAMALLLAGTLFVCATALDYSFGALQDKLTAKSLIDTGRTLDLAARTKLRLVRDSAAWDDTFDFLAGSNPGFPRTNYGPGVDTSGQDVILFYDARKRLVAAVQPQEPEKTWSPPPGVDPRNLLKEGLTVGLLATGGRVWMLAASPVTRTDGSGPSNGWLVYGTIYTQKRLADFSEVTGVGPVGFVTKRDVPTDAWVVFPTGEFGRLTGYFAPARKAPHPYPPGWLRLPVIDGDQLYMAVSLQIPVYERMLQTRAWMIALSIFCGVVFVGLSVLFLQIHVIRPISALERQMTCIADDEETDSELAVTQHDEIGRLAVAANRLLERSRLRQRDAENQHRLVETILDSASEGLIAYVAMRDAAGGIIDFQVAECNRAAERICHARPGEFIGRSARELFPTIEEAGIFEVFTRVLASGRSETFERAFYGERIKGWLRVSIVPWGDGLVVSFDDITQRKQHERELAETYAEIDRFNEAMIGREERVIEMKREVNALRSRLGLEPAYKEATADGED
jgi:sensor domain CHASE-containing protein/HAMP domain-containing protein